jgi:hypothetical protein
LDALTNASLQLMPGDNLRSEPCLHYLETSVGRYEINTVFKNPQILEHIEWSEKRLYADARSLAI